MLAVHNHPYPLQVLMFYVAVVIPVALIGLIIGNAIYKEMRRRRPPAH